MRKVWPMKIVQIIVTTAMATLVFVFLNERGVFKGRYIVPFKNGWVEDFLVVFFIFLPFIMLIAAIMHTTKKWLAQKYEEQEEASIYYYFTLVAVINFVIVLMIQFVFMERISSYSWQLPIMTLLTYESFELLYTRRSK